MYQLKSRMYTRQQYRLIEHFVDGATAAQEYYYDANGILMGDTESAGSDSLITG